MAQKTEYATAGGATLTLKQGLFRVPTWTCSGCGRGGAVARWSDESLCMVSDDEAAPGVANDHAEICRARP